jgi:hypothetical protein
LAAAEEQSVLRAAIIAKREELAALVSELSFEVCCRFAEESAAAYRQVLEAATALHAGLEYQRVLRARLVAAGYQLSDRALPQHVFPEAARLGDPNMFGSGTNPAASFRQWLITRGIIAS